MNFLNPFVLFGLIAASIPLILHLLNLRKMKTVEFSSLKFLKELQKSKIKSFKIKQILLLILRTLIIASIVMAFARPAIPTSLPFFQTYSKTSAIILIDNSFSMDVSDANGNRLKQAKNTAIKIINSLKEGDEVMLSELNANDSPSSLSYSKNFDFIKDKINKLQAKSTPANLNSTLKSISDFSASAANLNKSLFIITDAQKNIFDIKSKDTANLLSSFNNCYFVVIGGDNDADINNLSLDSLNVITSIFNYKKIVELELFVKNFSNNEIKDAVVSMNYDSNNVAQRSFTVPAKQNISVAIGSPIQSYGPTTVKLELEPDALNWDNSRYFGFNVAKQPRILIIGSHQGIDYIAKALQAVSSANDFANIDIIDNQKLSTISLDQYDIVITSNSNMSQNDANRLYSYIDQGGSCLLFPSNDYQSTNITLQRLGFGQADFREFAPTDAVRITSIDKNHPIFDGVFKINDNNNDIESPQLTKIMPPKSGIAIINTPVGNLLTENRIGDGRILYISSIPESNWGNLPFTGIFPTLVYRAVIYLTSSNEISQMAYPGDNVVVNLSKKFNSDSYKLVDPLGNQSYISPIRLANSLVLNLNKLDMLGIYTIYDSKSNFVKQVAVNFLPSESDLHSTDDTYIKEYLTKALGSKTSLYILNKPEKIDSEIIRATVGTELWQLFLILAIIFAIIEMIVQKTAKREASIEV